MVFQYYSTGPEGEKEKSMPAYGCNYPHFEAILPCPALMHTKSYTFLMLIQSFRKLSRIYCNPKGYLHVLSWQLLAVTEVK